MIEKIRPKIIHKNPIIFSTKNFKKNVEHNRKKIRQKNFDQKIVGQKIVGQKIFDQKIFGKTNVVKNVGRKKK